MIQEHKDIYDRYLGIFEEKFGEAAIGDSVLNEGHIVKKMAFEEFVVAWSELKQTEEFLRESMSRGNTLCDAVESQYRELAAQVLEKPKDFKIL